ncbi:MAG: crossover junction endodeoxyribonuclease RuvC [Candidatus Taylorbacteria bacterium]
MRIIAIDPGYERLGIAILERDNRIDRLLFSECFKTPSKIEFNKRLSMIGKEIAKLIRKFKPEILAIETLFFNSNQKTAMNVAEARGVIIYEASRNGIEVKEFTPLQVKMAITSYGRGDKKQMIAMIPKLINIEKKVRNDDEYDAIGVGITCLASIRSVTRHM